MAKDKLINKDRLSQYTSEMMEYIKSKEIGLSVNDVNGLIDEKLVPVNETIENKVEKVDGKGLSTNDYTDEDKLKIDSIPEDAKFTDTVYDDTTLSNRIKTIEDDYLSSEDKVAYISENNEEIGIINTVLTTGDIVDNLNSSSTTMALSAKQGNILKKRLDTMQTLPEGSTTADAALYDINIGYDGTDWKSPGNAIRGQIGQLSSEIADNIGVIKNSICNQSYANEILNDANNAEINKIYKIQTVDGTIISNLPDANYHSDKPYFLLTVSNLNNTMNVVSKNQLFIRDDLGEIYSRAFFDDVWYEWLKVDSVKKGDLDAYITAEYRSITSSDYLYLLENADNATVNTIYKIQTVDGTVIPNLPDVDYRNIHPFFLITFSNLNTNMDVVSKNQYFVRDDLEEIYTRAFFDGVWYEWDKVKSNDEITICVGENEKYSTLKTAIEYAYARGNVTIRVLDGVYDIVEEYGGALSGVGLMIGNNMKLYFSPKAKVICNYVGGDSAIQNDFAVFNAGDGDFEIHNLNIECKNIRYCIHDELNGADGFRIHKYVNCNMYLDNRANQHFDKYRQCIGGGLGSDCLILIEGGIYKSESCIPWYGTISYHNGYTPTCKSKIVVKDVYFDGEDSTIRFGYYGDSTEITDCIVCGCSMSTAPILRGETETTPNVNMVLKSWNNEIRQ